MDVRACLLRIGWPTLLKQLGEPRAASVKVRSSGVCVLLCLFHGEKTASLVCRPSGRFICYGCGLDGDMVVFLQALRGRGFDLQQFIIDCENRASQDDPRQLSFR